MVDALTLLEEFKNAVKFLQSGQTIEAEKICLKIHSLAPRKPDPLNLLAIIKAQDGLSDQADNYFIQALNLDSTRPDINANYAKFLLEQGRIDASIEHAKIALEIDGSQIDVLNILGQAYLAKKQLHAAISCFKQVLHSNPDHLLAHISLGNSYKSLGKLEEARSHIEVAVQISPQAKKPKQDLLDIGDVWLDTLEGQNIFLRPHQIADVEYLNRCFQNNDFMDLYNFFAPRNQTLSELAEQVSNNCQKHPYQTKRIDWVIFKKNTQAPIGLAALAGIQFQHRRAEFLLGIPEKKQRYGGAALEASLIVMDFVFNKVKFNKLTSSVYGSNPQAQKNTLALGFTQESFLRKHLYLHTKNSYVDLYGNGLLREDFYRNTRLSKLATRLLVGSTI